MANRVLTIFEGKVDQLFVAADRAEKRLKDFAQNTSNLQASPAAAAQQIGPVLQAQKQLTDGVKRESAAQVAAVADAGRRMTATAQKNAQTLNTILNSESNKKAFNEILESKVASDAKQQADILAKARGAQISAPLSAKQALENDRTVAAARDQIRNARLARESAAEERAAKLVTRRQAAEFVARDRAQIAYNIAYNKKRRELLAAATAIEQAETAVVVRETAKRGAARRASLFGQNSLAGGAARGAGIGGFAAGGPAAIAGFVAVAGIVSAVKAFEDANQRSLQLRANLEGLGLDYRKVGDEARAFAERHSQDLTTINGKYTEFVKLARAQRGAIEDVGQKAIDLASKRRLSDEQVIQGLRNINAGIADETLLGVSATTAITEYAAAHGVAAEQLTATQKAQVLFNEYLRQGNLAAGDHEKNITSLTTATTLLGNAWETANTKLGTFIENFLKNPQLALAVFGAAPGQLLNQRIEPAKPADPRLAAQAEAARQQSLANNQLAFARAQATASNERSVVDLALTKYVDRAKFLGPDADVAATAKANAIKAAQDEVKLTVDAYRASIKASEGDIAQSQQLLKGLFSIKGLIDPSEFKSLTDTLRREISSAITAAYQSRQQRQASANNVAEAQLQNFLARTEATEIQSIERMTDMRNRQIQAQIATDRSYYAQLIANASGNLGEIRRLNDELNNSIITKTNEMKANSLRAETEILKKRREILQESRSLIVGFAGQQNPYVRQLDEAAQAFKRIDRIAKDVGSNIGNALRSSAQEAFRFAQATQKIQDTFSAFDLLDRARDLRRGYESGDEDSIRERAKRELFPNYSSQEAYDNALRVQMDAVRAREARERQADLDRRIRAAQDLDDPRARNQAIIALTQGFRPGELSQQQRDLAAQASVSEARELLDAQKKATKFYDDMSKLISENGLKVSIANGRHVVEIRNKARDRADVTEAPSQQQTNDFYNPN